MSQEEPKSPGAQVDSFNEYAAQEAATFVHTGTNKGFDSACDCCRFYVKGARWQHQRDAERILSLEKDNDACSRMLAEERARWKPFNEWFNGPANRRKAGDLIIANAALTKRVQVLEGALRKIDTASVQYWDDYVRVGIQKLVAEALAREET